jgi:hypothetical protein
VERWAELRREHFVRGVSIRELVRRAGLSRNTVRAALRGSEAPSYSRTAKGSKLDPFKAEIGRLLGEVPALPGVRVGELLEPLGWDGGKTILDDYLREIRPLFLAARTTQRTIYRPGEICQFDVWQPRAEVPGRSRPDTPGLGLRCVSRLLARRRRGACVQQADGRSVGRDLALPLAARRAAEHVGLGSPGRHPRPRRAPVAGVRWALRPAEGRLALLPTQGSAGQGRRRAAAGVHGDQLRARTRVRERARLPGPARRVVRQGQRSHPQDSAR